MFRYGRSASTFSIAVTTATRGPSPDRRPSCCRIDAISSTASGCARATSVRIRSNSWISNETSIPASNFLISRPAWWPSGQGRRRSDNDNDRFADRKMAMRAVVVEEVHLSDRDIVRAFPPILDPGGELLVPSLKMSAQTSSVSPTSRFTAKRPQSTCGQTSSMSMLEGGST